MTFTRSTTPPLYDREITIAPEREALSRALAESEKRFQRLTQRIASGVFRVSAEGVFVEANPALVAMLGASDEAEIHALELGRDVFVNVREHERLRRLATQRPVERAVTRWRRRDGSGLTVRLSLLAAFDAEGVILHFDGIVEDVTDRVHQQELLQRTERMACLGATLAGVAHELNNPLAAILGFAQLLLKKETDVETRLALETIDHEAARAGKIVRDLLMLARKREVEHRTRINLNDVVSYIVGTRRYALETHGIACLVTIDPHLPRVVGDRTQLEQVVLNLLNNAEQAIRSARDDGGSVHISTRADGSWVAVEVEDNGPGIANETRERIWDPFWTTKGMGAGTGLGLSVVRDIVASHGGEIAAHAGYGAEGGARFVIQLPGLDAGDAGDDVPDDTVSRALDVLVVDGDAQSAVFLTAFLASRGHAALVATDVDYAVHLAEHLTFDAVICDSSLAQGNAVLNGLRSAAGCCGARFIIAAGDAKSTARLPFPFPASTALVMRPYDLEELRVLLED